MRRFGHVAPGEHAAFYASCAWQLNLTREEMRRWGWAPSVRLFEAAACGAPLLSDRWEGLGDVLRPDAEVLLVDGAPGRAAGPRPAARGAGPDQARPPARRVLAAHTYAHRAAALEGLLASLGAPGRAGGAAPGGQTTPSPAGAGGNAPCSGR